MVTPSTSPDCRALVSTAQSAPHADPVAYGPRCSAAAQLSMASPPWGGRGSGGTYQRNYRGRHETKKCAVIEEHTKLR